MVYGIGLIFKVFVVCIMVMLVIVLNMVSVVCNMLILIKDMGWLFFVSDIEIILKIIILVVLFVIFSGFWFGIFVGFIGVIFVELKIILIGVGDIIIYSCLIVDYLVMYVVIFFIIFFVVLFLNFLEWLEVYLFEGNVCGYVLD